eukprot:4577586-Prymnesium_polylepis.3
MGTPANGVWAGCVGGLGRRRNNRDPRLRHLACIGELTRRIADGRGGRDARTDLEQIWSAIGLHGGFRSHEPKVSSWCEGTTQRSTFRDAAARTEMDWLVVPPFGVLRSPATKSAHCAGAASKPQRICAPPSSESLTEHEASTAPAHQAAHSVTTAPVGPSRMVRVPTRFAYHCGANGHERARSWCVRLRPARGVWGAAPRMVAY